MLADNGQIRKFLYQPVQRFRISSSHFIPTFLLLTFYLLPFIFTFCFLLLSIQYIDLPPIFE